MFEIDSVRRAIESGALFEITDDVSDAYFDVVEIATRPILTDEATARFHRRRQTIDSHQTYILSLLEREQSILELLGEERSLQSAYLETIAQADSILAVA
jgi:hypothetical protein